MTQRTISKTLRLLPAAVLLACAGAHADDAAAPNELRLGAYFVHYKTTAHDLSGPYTPAGINIRVGNVTTTYITYVRHLDDNWALELAGGIPPTAKTYGKGPATVGSVPFNNQEVATAKWFSPSLLLDYRFLTPRVVAGHARDQRHRGVLGGARQQQLPLRHRRRHPHDVDPLQPARLHPRRGLFVLAGTSGIRPGRRCAPGRTASSLPSGHDVRRAGARRHVGPATLTAGRQFTQALPRWHPASLNLPTAVFRTPPPRHQVRA